MIYVSFHFGIKNENEKKKKQNICIINPQKILRVNKNKNYRKKNQRKWDSQGCFGVLRTGHWLGERRKGTRPMDHWRQSITGETSKQRPDCEVLPWILGGGGGGHYDWRATLSMGEEIIMRRNIMWFQIHTTPWATVKAMAFALDQRKPLTRLSVREKQFDFCFWHDHSPGKEARKVPGGRLRALLQQIRRETKEAWNRLTAGEVLANDWTLVIFWKY